MCFWFSIHIGGFSKIISIATICKNNFSFFFTGSYGKSNNHVRASFAGRENKAFSIGEKTRASFTARDSRAHFSTRQDLNEEVRMRNLEVMAEYEGTRTYRSAVRILKYLAWWNWFLADIKHILAIDVWGVFIVAAPGTRPITFHRIDAPPPKKKDK